VDLFMIDQTWGHPSRWSHAAGENNRENKGIAKSAIGFSTRTWPGLSRNSRETAVSRWIWSFISWFLPTLSFLFCLTNHFRMRIWFLCV
jgi:hypothetical protein